MPRRHRQDPGLRDQVRQRQHRGRARAATTATQSTATAARRLQAGGGIHLPDRGEADAADCKQSINKGEQCLELPIKYRDFKSEHEPGGHPDFFYYGSPHRQPDHGQLDDRTGAISFKQPRTASPTPPVRRAQNDSTARCWGLAQAELGRHGRPGVQCRANAAERPATASSPTGATTAGPTTSSPATANADHGRDGRSARWPTSARRATWSGHPGTRAGARRIAARRRSGSGGRTAPGRATARPPVSTPLRILELGPVPGGDEPLSVLERASQRVGRLLPARSGRPTTSRIYTTTGSSTGPGTVPHASAAPWSEPLLCNLWPYWYSSTTFGGGNGCKADQFVFAPAYGPTIASDPATWFGMNIKGGTHRRGAGLVSRLVVLRRGAVPIRLQLGVRSPVLRRRRHLRVHQRRADGRPRRRSPAPAGQGPRRRHGRRPRSRRAATSTSPAPTRRARPTARPSPPCTRWATSSPATAAQTPSIRSPRSSSTPPARAPTRPPAIAGCAPSRRRRPACMPGNTYEIAVFSRDGHPTESNFQLTLLGFSTNISTCGGILRRRGSHRRRGV